LILSSVFISLLSSSPFKLLPLSFIPTGVP
jgi:hypothetical protein